MASRTCRFLQVHTANDIGLKYDAQRKPIIPQSKTSCPVDDPVEELQDRITVEIVRDYVDRNHLHATDEEIREYQIHVDNSLAQDRIKRQKELAQLEERLKTAALSSKEREEAEKHRALLLRLAAHDKKMDEIGKPKIEDLRSIYTPWIEAWKFKKSIYEKYGGTVAITKFGPDPVGATSRLLAEYVKDKKLVILNSDLKSNFWVHVAEPPRFTAKPEEIDFTPDWQKPLSKDAN